MRQMRGDHDADDADLVASAPAAHVRNTKSVQLDLFTRLHPGGHLDAVLAAHRGHGDGVAENRLWNRDRQLEDDVLTVADQLRMRPHSESDIQVADGATTWAHLALAAEPQCHVLVDTRRNAHLDRVPHLDAALAAAARA